MEREKEGETPWREKGRRESELERGEKGEGGDKSITSLAKS